MDPDVKKLLAEAQKAAIVSSVTMEQGKLKLANEEFNEHVSRRIAETKAATVAKQAELRLASEKLAENVSAQIYEAQTVALAKAVALEDAKQCLAKVKTESVLEVDRLQEVGQAQNEATALGISTAAKLKAKQEETDLELKTLAAKADVEAKSLGAKANAFAAQMASMQPELLATLKSLGNQQLVSEVTKNLSPLAILGGGSVADVLSRLVGSLPIGMNGKALLEAIPELGELVEKNRR